MITKREAAIRHAATVAEALCLFEEGNASDLERVIRAFERAMRAEEPAPSADDLSDAVASAAGRDAMIDRLTGDVARLRARLNDIPEPAKMPKGWSVSHDGWLYAPPYGGSSSIAEGTPALWPGLVSTSGRATILAAINAWIDQMEREGEGEG